MASKKTIREGKEMVMVEEQKKKSSVIKKAKAKDVKHAPTKDKPRIAKKIREMSINPSSIKRNK